MSTYSFEATVNPGRFRKQKARVNHVVRTRRKQREEHAALEAKTTDRFHHTYAERVRLIRQMKTVLGYPLIKHEGFEYKSPYYTSKTLDDELVKKALRYWDTSAVTAETFDGFMALFEVFWEVEQWLLERATLVDYVECKGEWYKRSNTSNDRIPRFDHPYWMAPLLVDMSDTDWHKWKVRPLKEVLQKAIDAVANVPTNADGLVAADDMIKAGSQLNETLKRMQDNTAEGMVWNGMSSEHFTPRRSIWARIKSRLHEMLTGE